MPQGPQHQPVQKKRKAHPLLFVLQQEALVLPIGVERT